MISERAMAALRCAASVVCAVPHARMRVRHDGRVLLDVRRGAGPPDAVPHLPPCRFHDAVSRAYAQHRIGRPLRFLDLPGGAVPAVDVGVPKGDRVYGCGVMRVTMGPIWVHLVPVARSLEACRSAVDPLGIRGLAAYPDRALDVTILHMGTRAGDSCGARAAREIIETALVRCTVAQVEDHVRFNVTPM